MTFANRLKAWRGVTGRGKKARGKFSQAAAAARLGVPLRTYQNWEIGRYQPVGFARSIIEKALNELSAGRPIVESNQATRGTPRASGTGGKRVTDDEKKQSRKASGFLRTKNA